MKILITLSNLKHKVDKLLEQKKKNLYFNFEYNPPLTTVSIYVLYTYPYSSDVASFDLFNVLYLLKIYTYTQ